MKLVKRTRLWTILRPRNAVPHLVVSSGTENSKKIKKALLRDFEKRELGPIVETDTAVNAILDVGGSIISDAEWAVVTLPSGGEIQIRLLHVPYVLADLQTLRPRVDGSTVYYKIHTPIYAVVLSQTDVEFLKQEFACYPIRQQADVALKEFNRRMSILRNESAVPGMN